MSRRIGQPVRVRITSHGKPRAFTWRDMVYRVQVLSTWKLATRWWDYEREVDHTYYPVETRDHQIFELYRDAGQGDIWVLDVCRD